MNLFHRAGNPSDLYLLARCYFHQRQYQRVITLLGSQYQMLKDDQSDDLRFKYIASLSLVPLLLLLLLLLLPSSLLFVIIHLPIHHLVHVQAELQDWEASLNILGSDDAAISAITTFAAADLAPAKHDVGADSDTGVAAALCCVRGRCHEHLENFERAIFWYQRALRYDATCVEVLERLLERRLLATSAEQELLESLSWPPHLQWVQQYFRCAVDRNSYANLELAESQQSIAFGVTVEKEKSSNRNEELPRSTAPGATPNPWAVLLAPTNLTGAGLATNCDVLALKAQALYQRYDYQSCFELCKRIVEGDPFQLKVLPAYIACMTHLHLKSDLFYVSHQLVQAFPSSAIAWLAIGSYYFMLGKLEKSRVYFSKAARSVTSGPVHSKSITSGGAADFPALASIGVAAWLGFGHAFAAADESDQALGAYRYYIILVILFFKHLFNIFLKAI
jgi:anaphase-promoting complex subunit 6